MRCGGRRKSSTNRLAHSVSRQILFIGRSGRVRLDRRAIAILDVRRSRRIDTSGLRADAGGRLGRSTATPPSHRTAPETIR